MRDEGCMHNVTVADTVLVVKVTVGYPSQVQSE